MSTAIARQPNQICQPMRGLMQDAVGGISGPEELQLFKLDFPAEYKELAAGPAASIAVELQAESAYGVAAVKNGVLTAGEAMRTGRAAGAVLATLACHKCVACEVCPIKPNLEEARRLGNVTLQQEQRREAMAAEAQKKEYKAAPDFATRAELAAAPPEVAPLYEASLNRVLRIHQGHEPEFRELAAADPSASGIGRGIAKFGSTLYWQRAAETAKAQTKAVEMQSRGTRGEQDQIAAAKLEELDCAITSAVRAQETLTPRGGNGNQSGGIRTPEEIRKLKEQMSHVIGLVRAVGEHYADLNATAIHHHLEGVLNWTLEGEDTAFRKRASNNLWHILRGAMAEAAVGQLLEEVRRQDLRGQEHLPEDQQKATKYEHTSPEVDVAEGYDYLVTMPNGIQRKLDVKAGSAEVGTSRGYKVSLDERSAGKVTIVSPVHVEEMQGWFRLPRRLREGRAQLLRGRLNGANQEAQAITNIA